MVISVSWLDQPYMVISQICTYYTYSGPIFQYEFNGDVGFMIGLTIYGNFSSIHILYTFWIYFSIQIWWWCLFYDQTNHIWWFLKVCIYYTYSGLIFQYECNGEVCFMIGLTIYGNFSSMHIYTYSGLIFYVNLTIRSIGWSDWPFTVIS